MSPIILSVSMVDVTAKWFVLNVYFEYLGIYSAVAITTPVVIRYFAVL